MLRSEILAKDVYGEEGSIQSNRSYMPEPEEQELKHSALAVVPGGRWD